MSRLWRSLSNQFSPEKHIVAVHAHDNTLNKQYFIEPGTSEGSHTVRMGENTPGVLPKMSSSTVDFNAKCVATGLNVEDNLKGS